MTTAPAILLAIALGTSAGEAPAQAIAYRNLLQFDLQSFTSQATAGLFSDDVDAVGDSRRMMAIEGNRLFTSFSNLARPATLGDNLLTYSLDHAGTPSTANLFDPGSYLVGWMGKRSVDSAYNFEIFYQHNSSKTMFENLEDGALGDTFGSSNDAEYSGWTRTTTHDDSTGAVVGDRTTTIDLQRWDRRGATNLDFGVARDLSERLTVGGRLFYENDRLDSWSNGNVESIDRVDTGGGLTQLSRSTTRYAGPGEAAFQEREFGIGLDADYHPWDAQNLNVRLEISSDRLVNPSPNLGTSDRAQPTGPFDPVGTRIDLREDFRYALVFGGAANPGGNPLDDTHENVTLATTDPYDNGSGYSSLGGGTSLAVARVDDVRSGLGISTKVEWGRESFGGWNDLWVGLARRSLDVDATIVGIDREYSTLWWNGGAGDREARSTSLDETMTLTRAGDSRLSALELGSRWKRDLNGHVGVGLGLILTRSRWTDDYRQTTDHTRITDRFDDGDDTANALYTVSGGDPTYNERETRLETRLQEDIVDESTNRLLRLPVGAQFRFKQRWTVNVGAQHTIARFDRETSTAIPADGNGLSRTTVHDEAAGTTVVTYDDSFLAGREQATKLEDHLESNYTTYWYGISVLIADVAQLDVNGFFDTHSGDQGLDRADPNFGDDAGLLDVDFFRNLAISLKFIIW
ncbi:MAG: hypothetical protein R3B81_04520 [bacterium]